MGLVCNSDEQSKITTEELFQNAILDAGVTCDNYDSRDYAGTPFFNKGACRYLKAGKESVCDENKESHHRALCYCDSTL